MTSLCVTSCAWAAAASHPTFIHLLIVVLLLICHTTEVSVLIRSHFLLHGSGCRLASESMSTLRELLLGSPAEREQPVRELLRQIMRRLDALDAVAANVMTTRTTVEAVAQAVEENGERMEKIEQHVAMKAAEEREAASRRVTSRSSFDAMPPVAVVCASLLILILSRRIRNALRRLPFKALLLGQMAAATCAARF